MPWASLQCVIVLFPDHTHLLFNRNEARSQTMDNSVVVHDLELAINVTYSAMILININGNMAPKPIIGIPLIKHIVLIAFCSTKFLLLDV